MPELPEVETTCRSLEPLLNHHVTQVEVRQPKLRWMVPSSLSELIGMTLVDIRRRAKYIIVTFKRLSHTDSHPSDEHSHWSQCEVIIHLGMSGSLQQRDYDAALLKHDHVVFHMTAENSAQQLTHSTQSKHSPQHHAKHGEAQSLLSKLCYHDPRRFGAILWHHEYAEKLFDHLGPEPLSDEFDADYLFRYVKKTTRPIKAVIMDQACVVGVGNIYATESLFFSGIHPLKSSKRVTKKQCVLLVSHIKRVLAQAIELGGSSLRDFTDASGKTGYFQQTLLVYGRAGEACEQCGGTIETVKITQRASAFCRNCQKK